MWILLAFLVYAVGIDAASVPSPSNLLEKCSMPEYPERKSRAVRTACGHHFNYGTPFSTDINVSKPTLWPKGIVPYTIGTGFDKTQRFRITETMKGITKQTQSNGKNIITFKKRHNEPNYIRFVKGNECSSSVGQIGGQQDITFGNGCFRRNSTIYHEVLHALGLIHEHARYDRDVHVNINWNRIPDTLPASNYQRYISDSDTFWYKEYIKTSPYDFKSVMHYLNDDFGCGKIITQKGPYAVESISRPEDGLSSFDAIKIRNLYRNEFTPSLPFIDTCLIC